MSNLLNTKPLKEVMLESEEVSYVKHNPTMDSPRPNLDNKDTVQQYFLNRLSAPFATHSAGKGPISEKFTDVATATTQFANDNLVAILLTFIFMLIVAIVVLEIMHTRKIYKIVKTMMKNINELHHKA
jgi:hypothetical protein